MGSHRATGRADGTAFELAHEALISSWPRLHGWVAEQRSHLVTARALGTATERWTAADRDPDWLLHGRMLRRVERGLAAGALTLSEGPEAALPLALVLLDDVCERVPERRAELASLLHRGIHRHRLVRRGSGLGARLAIEPVPIAAQRATKIPEGIVTPPQDHSHSDRGCSCVGRGERQAADHGDPARCRW